MNRASSGDRPGLAICVFLMLFDCGTTGFDESPKFEQHRRLQTDEFYPRCSWGHVEGQDMVGQTHPTATNTLKIVEDLICYQLAF